MIEDFVVFSPNGYQSRYARDHNMPYHPRLFIGTASGSVVQNDGGQIVDLLLGATIISRIDPAGLFAGDATVITEPHMVLVNWEQIVDSD